MPSPTLLDFDALLKPLEGETPAGETVPFGVRKKLDEHRKEISLEQFAADDPTRPDKPKYADWPAIIQLGKETLSETSKDLLVAARLTEALTKDQGFAGLRDGLKLLDHLIGDCWDRIHPSIEDGDLEVRASGFNWLDDSERGARFPYTIRTIPFLPDGDVSYSYQDFRSAMELKDGKEVKGKVPKAKIDQAVQGMTWEQTNLVVEDLKEGLANLDHLVETLTEKLGEVAPGMVEVRRSMNECLSLAEQVLSKKTPPKSAVAPTPAKPVPASTASAEVTQTVGAVMVPLVPKVETREDVYVQLSEISVKMMQLDPHSPITYLVQRAVKLSKLSLPELMKVLIRDSASLTELDRDLGFKD